jgi:LDH2 family malate/lactate/ureidoglycolate dehydrogenase
MCTQTHKAVAEAAARAQKHGVATVVIRNSTHTGCLQAFLSAATSKGCMVIVASSAPGVRSVAPYGVSVAPPPRSSEGPPSPPNAF